MPRPRPFRLAMAALLAGTAAHAAPGDSGIIPGNDRAAVLSQLQGLLETERSGVERSFRTPFAVVVVTAYPAFSRRTRAPCGDCGDPCRPYRMRYQQNYAQEIPIIEGARCRTADGNWVGFEEKLVGRIDLRPPPQAVESTPSPAPQPAPSPPQEPVQVAVAPPPPPPPPAPPPPPPPPWRADPEAVGLLRSLRYLDGNAAAPDRKSYEQAVREFGSDRGLSPSPSGGALIEALHAAASRELAIASCDEFRPGNGAVCRR